MKLKFNRNIETHRLRELILQDVSTYPNSSINEISQRIGTETPFRKIKFQLYQMVSDATLKIILDHKIWAINQ